MKLKHRLSLSLMAVTAMALGGSFAAVAFLVHREETGDLDRAIAAQAHAVGVIAVQRDPTRMLVADGDGEIPEVPTPTTRYVAIYGTGGEVISSTASFAGQTPDLAALGLPDPIPREGATMNLRLSGHSLRAVVVPVPGRTERLLYAVSRRSVDEDMRFLFQVFSLLFVMAMAVTAFFARWLGSRLASDVGAIAIVAQRVSAGDLAARVRGGARGSAETRALGDDLDRMIAQLDSLMVAQRTFVSHAAHELRSPLATLRGELQLALRRPRVAEEYKASIEDALGEVEALTALAEDLLILARVQRTHQSERVGASVIDAIADAQRMARGPAEARGVTISVDAKAPEELCVWGARTDVARALRNLLDNAVEHSPVGGTVRLSLSLSDSRALISVEDDGDGVNPADAPHLFSAFYRGAKDRSGDTRGTGLGLAIVREIVSAYGGDVRVAAPKKGARFEVELPLAPEGVLGG